MLLGCKVNIHKFYKISFTFGILFSVYCVAGWVFSKSLGVPSGRAVAYSGVFFLYVTLLIAFIGATGGARIKQIIDVTNPNYKFDYFLLFLAVVGVVLIIYDRSVYRGVNIFDMTFAEIREHVNIHPSSSNIFSMSGNVLQVLYLVSLPRLIVFWEKYYSDKTNHRIYLSSLIIFCLFFSSYFLGGRTLFLLFFAIFCASVVIRIIGERDPLLGFNRALIIGSLFVAYIIAIGVFWVRARIGDQFIPSSLYLEFMLSHLDPNLTDFTAIGVTGYGVLGDILNYTLCLFGYLFHQLWVFEDLLSSESLPGFTIANGLNALILKRVGFGLPTAEYQGVALSLPAVLVYDFGLAGLLVGGLFIALLAQYGLAKKFNNGYTNIFVILVALTMYITSPITFVFNIPYSLIVLMNAIFILLVNVLIANIRKHKYFV